MNFDTLVKRIDVRFGLPRPATGQHLSAYKAALVLIETGSRMAAAVACGIVGAYFFVLAWRLVDPEWWGWGLAAWGAASLSLLVGFSDAGALTIDFTRLTSRETHGAARWAKREELERAGLIRPRGAKPDGRVKIGEFGWRNEVVLDLERFCSHIALFGPPGSGKSKSFFVPILREWAAIGASITLDTKGELYRLTASAFDRVYRIDIDSPLRSDRLDLVSPCKEDAEYANDLAGLITALDTQIKNAKEPFWPRAEVALLKALLIYVAHKDERPHPAACRELMARYPKKALGDKLLASGLPPVIEGWRLFSEADPKLQASIRLGLSTVLEAFASPHAAAVLTPPTREERDAGVASFDLRLLRRRGTCLYVVVSEGSAGRYENVLAAIFGAAQMYLRSSGAAGASVDVPALVAIDEAGNIPIAHLAERLGVGRGLRVAYMLGYQGLPQILARYGRDWAAATLASVGTKIFLPGLGPETCSYATELAGRTTALARQSTDGVGSRYDNERATETGRNLIDPADVRQMLAHTEALAIISTEPPVRLGIPRLDRLDPLDDPTDLKIVDPTRPYRSVVDEDQEEEGREEQQAEALDAGDGDEEEIDEQELAEALDELDDEEGPESNVVVEKDVSVVVAEVSATDVEQVAPESEVPKKRRRRSPREAGLSRPLAAGSPSGSVDDGRQLNLPSVLFADRGARKGESEKGSGDPEGCESAGEADAADAAPSAVLEEGTP